MAIQCTSPGPGWQDARFVQAAGALGPAADPIWQVVLMRGPAYVGECFAVVAWPAAEAQSRRWQLATFTLPDAHAVPFAMDELVASQIAVHALVVDAELICSHSLPALRHYRQLRPQLPWLLAWDTPSAQRCSQAYELRAQGGLAWSTSREQLAQALDAVRAGELWFPRRVLQALYVAALGAQPLVHIASHDDHAAPGLTEREAQVLARLRQGHSNKQIAIDLNISLNTVKKHLAHVYAKLGVHNGRQAAA